MKQQPNMHVLHPVQVIGQRAEKIQTHQEKQNGTAAATVSNTRATMG
jgi:hypothetical protein